MAKYFLDRDGVPTGRMRGPVGQGHIAIANEIMADRLQPGGDVYEQMFELGFVRVEETDEAVLVDSPRCLTRKQQKFLDGKERDGKRVTINDPAFIAHRSEVPRRS